MLATGATLVGEWPVTGSVADVATGAAVGAVLTEPSVDDARPSSVVDDRIAGRPGSAGSPGPAGWVGASPRPGQDRAAVSRSGERDGGGGPAEPTWLAGCGGDGDLDDHPNGTLPDDELCALPTTGHHLRPSAARAWWRLDAAYRTEFGTSMCVTDSYRSLEQQESLAVTKPGLAAQPGTSNHGWGSALDLCGGVESFGTVQHEWLRVRAQEWGWENPSWAQADGSKPEAWHWEYRGDD